MKQRDLSGGYHNHSDETQGWLGLGWQSWRYWEAVDASVHHLMGSLRKTALREVFSRCYSLLPCNLLFASTWNSVLHLKHVSPVTEAQKEEDSHLEQKTELTHGISCVQGVDHYFHSFSLVFRPQPQACEPLGNEHLEPLLICECCSSV